MEVQPPATVLTTPGTYRLTVVDPVRREGDVFVVASQGSVARRIIEAGRISSTSLVGSASPAEPGVGVANVADAAGHHGTRATPSPMIFEGVDNTAIGNGALAAITSGRFNTASGAQALYSNTTGSQNAAHGAYALYSNTTGNENAASGENALFANSTGRHNTASGVAALYANTTGSWNVATGHSALSSTCQCRSECQPAPPRGTIIRETLVPLQA